MARLPWAELPEAIRTWAETVLGARVISAASQRGGFSPGVAARLTLADGRGAFCKAVSARTNPDSPGMHRREAMISAALPATVPAPAFLGSYDDGEWVALLFAAVDGRPPSVPWRRAELDLVLSTINQTHQACTPSPVPGLSTLAEQDGDAFAGWRSLAAGTGGRAARAASRAASAAGPSTAPIRTATAADPWVRRNLDRLAELEAAWTRAAVGDTLLHNDLRADNVLIGPRQTWLVDWPLACTGAAWCDIAFMAPSVAMDGGPEPEWLMTRTTPHDHDALAAVVAALAGFFAYQATRPAPPGLPTLRAFQERQAVPAVAWLRRLTGWP